MFSLKKHEKVPLNYLQYPLLYGALGRGYRAVVNQSDNFSYFSKKKKEY